MRTGVVAKIMNTLEQFINPATEEKQDDIIAAIGNVGFVSTDNSSVTPLGIDEVFTGDAEDISDYLSITVSVFTDKASAVDGLSIQFSSDGTNWDHPDPHTVIANESHITTLAPQAQYFRIVYTNGGAEQGIFRLQSIFYKGSVGPTIEEIGGDIADTTQAITTRSVLSAKKPGGDYVNIDATNGGNLKISLEELETQAVNQIRTMSGASANGVRALASADTWYAVPSTVPASPYVLVVSKENEAGIIRYGLDNTGTPSTTNGNKMTSDDIVFSLAENEVVYFGSSTGGDDVNWTTKII